MSIAAMNASFKSNRALLSSQKKKGFKSTNREGIYTLNNNNKVIPQFKKTSKIELKLINENIKNQADTANKKELLIYFVIFTITLILILYFL